jgi:hypothetical protein
MKMRRYVRLLFAIAGLGVLARLERSQSTSASNH